MNLSVSQPLHGEAQALMGGLDSELLERSNVNPDTGLATDYLNHFNEAIMLLEMLAMAPDCIEDFLEWKPMNYVEHFTESNYTHRDVAIAAYGAASPIARISLDQLTERMTGVLVFTRDAMRAGLSAETAVSLAERVSAALKPLVARAGAIINGTATADDETAALAPQAAVDALMER